jgi:hypothetical protein
VILEPRPCVDRHPRATHRRATGVRWIDG